MNAWPRGAWVKRRMPIIVSISNPAYGFVPVYNGFTATTILVHSFGCQQPEQQNKLQRRFQRVDKHLGDIKTGLLLDFLEASRAGDVDFSQIIANHI